MIVFLFQGYMDKVPLVIVSTEPYVSIYSMCIYTISVQNNDNSIKLYKVEYIIEQQIITTATLMT